MLLEYDVFEDELEKTIYKNSKSYLLKKIAENPNRYVGLFRTTSPKMKLMQNITQSHEISFGDFVENIITIYLGNFYTNLPKSAKYNNEDILFDQLFMFENNIYMVEQKIRDDHDSSKKRGQYSNFLTKVEYLMKQYPDRKIIAAIWFVDSSLKKNKRYYLNRMDENKKYDNANIYLFYGNQLFEFLDKISIWNEMVTYLEKWKECGAEDINLNLEINWEETKEEIINNITKKQWLKLLNNQQVVDEIFPIIFPDSRYKEINQEELN
ncbi:MAG: hypothetical protein RR050_03930 [Bacilli bacterium]